MEDTSKILAIFKVCLIGQGGVGKTCIAKRLCFNSFDLDSKLTIGISFYSYKVPVLVKEEKQYITLSIWDFGGQEQFKSLFNYYINGANGIYMVFSLVNLQTLLGLDWWYDNLQKFGHAETPSMLIGAKQDIAEVRNDQSVVDDLIIKQFMKRHEEATFYRTSSKENYNIKSIFKEMTKLLLDKNKIAYDKLL